MGDDELGFEVEMGSPLRWRGRRGGGEWRSGRSLGAGRSSSPSAHEPGPRQELGRRKKNPQYVGSHPSHQAEQRIILLMRALVSSGLPWCFSTEYEVGWTRV